VPSPNFLQTLLEISASRSLVNGSGLSHTFVAAKWPAQEKRDGFGAVCLIVGKHLPLLD
jgi:hypothetical protein